MRRAPEEVAASRRPPGVLRSELVPEEVRGLRKAGDLTQMLPAEAAMLAMGWPRGGSGDEREADEDEEGPAAPRGSHPARLLFMARLAEKGLMSYQRTGARLIRAEPRFGTAQHPAPALFSPAAFAPNATLFSCRPYRRR